MRIGYPCINRSLPCGGNRTFRLKSYSRQRLAETVSGNLDCLERILRFNGEHRLLFFRITSGLVPFASHPVCDFAWQEFFRDRFRGLGGLVRRLRMRISMHPDPFTLINSADSGIWERSVRELAYHAEVLDLMGLDRTAKIQIHVGGVYGDKGRSLARFIERYALLPAAVRRRLVVENDERSYTLQDCLLASRATGIPVIFDVLHHRANSSGESLAEAFRLFPRTWKKRDGAPMVDYSSEKKGERRWAHAESLELRGFRRFLAQTAPVDFDVMLEVKDKEESALRALRAAARDSRFFSPERKPGHPAGTGHDSPGPAERRSPP